MAKTKANKDAVKKNTTKRSAKKGTSKKRERASTGQTERKDFVPFDVCNYYGVYLREIFENEHLRNRNAPLGEVFERLLSDLHGAWNLVKLYGRDTPLETLRGKGNPFLHGK